MNSSIYVGKRFASRCAMIASHLAMSWPLFRGASEIFRANGSDLTWTPASRTIDSSEGATVQATRGREASKVELKSVGAELVTTSPRSDGRISRTMEEWKAELLEALSSGMPLTKTVSKGFGSSLRRSHVRDFRLDVKARIVSECSTSLVYSSRLNSPLQLNWGRHFGRLLWLEVPDEAREVLAQNEALPKYDKALAFTFVVEKLKNVSKADDIAPETVDWRVRKLKRVQVIAPSSLALRYWVEGCDLLLE